MRAEAHAYQSSPPIPSSTRRLSQEAVSHVRNGLETDLLLQDTHTVESARKDSHAEEQTISQQELILSVVRTDQVGTARDETRLEHAHQEA